jgi:hypothetical protein
VSMEESSGFCDEREVRPAVVISASSGSGGKAHTTCVASFDWLDSAAMHQLFSALYIVNLQPMSDLEALILCMIGI